MSNPTANMPRGIDVSKHQRNIDWSRVAGDGIRFAFARAIDDAPPGTKPDPFFEENFAEMKEVGIFRGAYYFFRPRRDVAAAANLFVSIVGELRPGDLQPVIDVEALPLDLSVTMMLDSIARWMDIVEGALGRQVIIYTNPDTWINRLQNSARFSDHPLWISSLREVPKVPSAFPTFTFHQHSFEGRVSGINGDVDLDRFNGSINGLRAFADLPPIGGGVLSVSAAAPAVAPLVVHTIKATPVQLSSANSAKTAKGEKVSPKKQITRKGPSKKAVTKKADAKAGAKKRPAARKGAAKKGTKRGSKKGR